MIHQTVFNRMPPESQYFKRHAATAAFRVVDRLEPQLRYQIVNMPNLTVGTVLELCDRIAKAIGGELYGTVNFDFTVHDKITFEMMVEQFRN